MEGKQQKFERLAEKRTNEAIKKIRLIGNLANRKNYSYSDEHIKQLFDALESEVKIMKSRFKEESDKLNTNFKFKI